MMDDILQDIKTGKFILITDDHDRENEADLFVAAEFIDNHKLNFLLNEARGLITHPISNEIAEKLSLPLMVKENEGTDETAFTISVDAKENTESGISTKDRVTTIKLLANENAKPSDFSRPGHCFPLVANSGGLKKRKGHTEAAIELLKLCNLYPVAVICETLNSRGDVLRGKELQEFSIKHQIKIVSIKEIISYQNY